MEKEKKVTKSNKTVKKSTGTKNTKNTKSAKSTKTTTKKVENKGNKKVETKEVKKTVVKDNNVKAEIINKKDENVKKEIKPSKSINDSSADFGGEEIRKLLIIIGAVCAVMLAFYFITEVVLKNKEEKEPTKEPEIKIEPEIQYEQILMGSLLNQNESTYYVFVYDEDDHMLDIYNQYLETYKNSDNEPLNVYRVNLSEDFNKAYVAEESYLEGSDMSKIKVTGTTLIRVKNDEVYKYYEGYEEISEKLKSMID